MSKDKLKDLQEKSIPSLILSYSLVTFASLALNSIYTLIDAIFIGRGIGPEALGGITAVLPFTVLQGAVAAMLGGGAAILVSQYLGKQDRQKAGETVFCAAIAFWVTALIITALGLIFIEPFLKVLGAADSLKGYAKQYLTILLIFNIFSTGFSPVMRAEGKMLYALLQWVLPISVNIIFDAVFVFVLKWGVKGAAYATALCQITGFITAIIYFIKFSSLDFKRVKWKIKTLQNVLSAGLPSLVQMGSMAVGMMILNNILNFIGGEGLQITYGFISKIFTFCMVPLTAITQALQPIAGYNHGAGNLQRVKTTMQYTVLFSFAAAVVTTLICEAMPHLLIGIFTSDDAYIRQAVPALRWVAAALPFMFLPSAAGVLLQSTGKKVSATFLFAASFIFIPPFALLFGVLGLNIWSSFPLAGGVATVIAVVVLVIFLKQYGTQNEKIDENAAHKDE